MQVGKLVDSTAANETMKGAANQGPPTIEKDRGACRPAKLEYRETNRATGWRLEEVGKAPCERRSSLWRAQDLSSTPASALDRSRKMAFCNSGP
jgi:hypothetical protein